MVTVRTGILAAPLLMAIGGWRQWRERTDDGGAIRSGDGDARSADAISQAALQAAASGSAGTCLPDGVMGRGIFFKYPECSRSPCRAIPPSHCALRINSKRSKISVDGLPLHSTAAWLKVQIGRGSGNLSIGLTIHSHTVILKS
jgi:hypothetical protein